MAGESGRRILVTGALGQIGTELVAALRQRHSPANVIACDIREVAGHPVIDSGPFHIADVLDWPALENIVTEQEIGTIYHLAALLSATGEKNPGLCQAVNIGGLVNMLELARMHNLRLFAPSSIAVFGPDCPDTAPQDAPMHPTTMYGVTKVAGEIMADYYHNVHKVDCRGIRYPGLISWKAPAGGGTTDYAVEIFHEALEAGRFDCFVKRETRLPMMYMDDAIRATLELMDAPEQALGAARNGYNVAGCSFTAGELADAIAEKIAGFECTFSPDERQEYADSWPSEVDDSQARSDWGWSAEFGLEEMVDEMLTNLQEVKRISAE